MSANMMPSCASSWGIKRLPAGGSIGIELDLDMEMGRVTWAHILSVLHTDGETEAHRIVSKKPWHE